MIHVGVRNERVRDAQELARGQRRHVAEVEQQGAAAETEMDEQRGIRKGVVDEPRLHEPSHFLPPSRSIGATCRRRSAASRETKVPGRDLCTRYLTVENRGRKCAGSSVRLPTYRTSPPQSRMFTEPKARTQRLSGGQHCGAWNAQRNAEMRRVRTIARGDRSLERRR